MNIKWYSLLYLKSNLSRSKRANPGYLTILCISSTLLFYCSSVIQNLWSRHDLIYGSICETENHEEKVKKIQKQFTKNLSLMHLWYPYHSTLTHNTGSSSDSEYPTMHRHHAISICIHTFAHSETLALKSLSTSREKIFI